MVCILLAKIQADIAFRRCAFKPQMDVLGIILGLCTDILKRRTSKTAFYGMTV